MLLDKQALGRWLAQRAAMDAQSVYNNIDKAKSCAVDRARLGSCGVLGKSRVVGWDDKVGWGVAVGCRSAAALGESLG